MDFNELVAPYDDGDCPITDTPMSRTHQYRKVMKPLLERKRRARINKCLDNLKDIMVNALQAEGESITKLEKADVLELTVKHLKKLKQQNALGLTPQATYAGRFRGALLASPRALNPFGLRTSDGHDPDQNVLGPCAFHLSPLALSLAAIFLP